MTDDLHTFLDGTFAAVDRAVTDHHARFEPREVGTVQYVGQGVALVDGLPGVQSEEIVSFGGDALGMRHGDWKLIVRTVDGAEHRELFNIADDPTEQHDRVSDCPAIVNDLADRIAEQRTRDGTSARGDVDSPMVS